MAAELHPSLGASPAAKPVCCGCGTADDNAVLVPVFPTNRTTFICGTCAGMAYAAAVGEHLRRACEHLLDIDPFAPAEPSRALQ